MAAIVGAWLVWIGRELPFFYGEFGDDYYTSFRIGLATIADWHQAFAGWHVNALYYFLISYLPLKLHLMLPGVVLPDFSHEHIALFRGLTAYIVLVHAGILVCFALLAYQVTGRLLVATLATILLASNPLFVLMATTPESRVVGLVFALPGMALLLACRWNSPRVPRATMFKLIAAGALLTTSYLIHYTALYLIVPFLTAYALVHLLTTRYHWALVKGGLAIVAGVVAPQALVEGIGAFVLHIPNSLANFSALSRANAAQLDPNGTYAQKAREWTTSYLADVSGPVLLAAALGAAILLGVAVTRRKHASTPTAWILLSTLALGIGLPFATFQVPYRSQSAVQPIVLLLAAVGLTAAYDGLDAGWDRVRRRQRSATWAWRVLPLLVCLAAVAAYAAALWPPLQAALVRRANFGHQLATAPQPMVFSVVQGNVVTQEFFDQYGLGISPAQVLDMEPSVYLYGCTDTSCWHLPDRGRLLSVEAVTADSEASSPAGLHDAGRVLDGGISHDGITEWLSEGDGQEHWIELRFAQAYELEEAVIANRRQGIRADVLDVYGLVDGAWVSLYRGGGLSRSPVIHARWPRSAVSGLRFVIGMSLFEGAPSPRAEIDELYFPGYRAVLASAGERPTLEPLQIRAIDADSVKQDTWSRWTPEHLFDYELGRGDGYSAWISESRPRPHHVEVHFARPYLLDNAQVINALQSQLVNGYATRIDQLEIWLYGSNGWSRVWEGQNLGSQVVVSASWAPMEATSAAFVVKRSLLNTSPIDDTLIQEIVFPGYFAVFDWPRE